jgi:hypothetical protein
VESRNPGSQKLLRWAVRGEGKPTGSALDEEGEGGTGIFDRRARPPRTMECPNESALLVRRLTHATGPANLVMNFAALFPVRVGRHGVVAVRAGPTRW